MEPDGTFIMGNSSSLSPSRFQDAVSVGKLELDDAMIDRVYDLLFAIFK